MTDTEQKFPREIYVVGVGIDFTNYGLTVQITTEVVVGQRENGFVTEGGYFIASGSTAGGNGSYHATLKLCDTISEALIFKREKLKEYLQYNQKELANLSETLTGRLALQASLERQILEGL